jgi:hypothetical protein
MTELTGERTTIIPCGACAKRLRIPLRRGIARCPCGWTVPVLMSATPNAARALDVRCAVRDEHYAIAFTRDGSAGLFRIAAVLRSSDARALGYAPEMTGERRGFHHQDFDFSGWRCDGCGDAGDARTLIVRCETCGYLVCAGRVRDLPGGVRTFRCGDSCSGSGELTDLAGDSVFRGVDGSATPIRRLGRAAHAPVAKLVLKLAKALR